MNRRAMTASTCNRHGTAIVIGTAGLFFSGPSGSGKSMLAFACMAAARARGLFAALIADDQVFIETIDGYVLARRPPAIAGLMEFRGTGIGAVESLPEALLHIAVRPVNIAGTDRLPPQSERLDMGDGIFLPLVRLPVQTPDPLAVLGIFAREPGLHSGAICPVSTP